ncbi:MAG: hypothetical protein V8S77_06625 [Oscillospiraceae bacterium]
MKKAVYYILLAVFIGVFLFAAYQIGSYMLEKHKSDEVLKDAGKYVYIPDLSRTIKSRSKRGSRSRSTWTLRRWKASTATSWRGSTGRTRA